MGFNHDNKFGQIYETYALKFFEYTACKHHEGNFKFYDWKIRDSEDNIVRIEVKADRIAHRTDNVVVEFENNNKPSGITTTRADIYMIFIIMPQGLPRVFKITTASLRDICKGKSTTQGGDWGRSRMYILKVRDLLAYEIDAVPMD